MYKRQVHSKKTGRSLTVRQKLDTPKERTEWVIEVNKKNFGSKFKQKAKVIDSVLSNFSRDELISRHKELNRSGKFTCRANGEIVELDSSLVTIKMKSTLQHIREYIPNVIEPSFGLGRIIYCIFDHCFQVRADNEARTFFSFPLQIAPIKVCIATISNNSNFPSIVKKISQILRKKEIYFKTDDSNTSIGKKYARNDELGAPFVITIDFETMKDDSVTLRERNSMKQVRGSIDDVISVIDRMTHNPEAKWENSTLQLSPIKI